MKYHETASSSCLHFTLKSHPFLTNTVWILQMHLFIFDVGGFWVSVVSQVQDSAYSFVSGKKGKWVWSPPRQISSGCVGPGSPCLLQQQNQKNLCSAMLASLSGPKRHSLFPVVRSSWVPSLYSQNVYGYPFNVSLN